MNQCDYDANKRVEYPVYLSVDEIKYTKRGIKTVENYKKIWTAVQMCSIGNKIASVLAKDSLDTWKNIENV